MGNTGNKARLDARRRSLEEVIQHSYTFKDLKFDWDASKRGRHIQFADQFVKAYGPWGLCMPSALVISPSTCIEYEFEIKIHHDSHEKGSSIMMGFIFQSLLDAGTMDYNHNMINIDDSEQFAFQIGYGKDGLFKFYGENKAVADSLQLPPRDGFSNGDSFRLKIDFDNNDIDLYHNDRLVATVFNKLPSNIKLIPCIALKNAQIELSSSKYMSALESQSTKTNK